MATSKATAKHQPPAISDVTVSGLYQGCIIHTPETVNAIAAVASALGVNAQALQTLATSIGGGERTFTESMIHIGTKQGPKQ